jgi:two-component system sensor histidine kinase YesM
LNTIKFLATLQGTDNIGTIAESLSSLMHTNMTGGPFITIQDDIEFIKSYLTIQSYRNTSVFQYRIEADSGLQDYMIPKLLIQPLAENALKHGLSEKTVNGMIQIIYYREGSALHIRVEDNGIGMSESEIKDILSRNHNPNAGHIGIYNIQERIKLYFGDEYGISVESQKQLYTRFDVSIPLLQESDVKTNEKNITG